MGEVDRKRAAEILRIAAIITDKSSNQSFLVFLSRDVWQRAKILLEGAGLAESREEVKAFDPASETYWLPIKPDKKQELLDLLPCRDMPGPPVPKAKMEVISIEEAMQRRVNEMKDQKFVMESSFERIEDGQKLLVGIWLSNLQSRYGRDSGRRAF